MGCCCYPSPDGSTTQSTCVNVSSSDACGFGGFYSEGPCGGCGVNGLLGMRLSAATAGDEVLEAAVQPTYFVIQDFRDVIMRRSEFGRAALALFDEYEGRLFELLDQDEGLRSGWLSLLARASIFAQDVLRLYAYGPDRVAAGGMRIDRAIFGDVEQFLRRLDELAPDGEFDGLLARGTVIFEALANLTSRDVLALLAVEDDEARR